MDENQLYSIIRKSVSVYMTQEINQYNSFNPGDVDECLRFLSDIYFEYCKNKEI